jgi:hypothetical protein
MMERTMRRPDRPSAAGTMAGTKTTKATEEINSDDLWINDL